jgi:hypothetical protein
MTPVDDDAMPPPPRGVDRDYLTQDIVSALDRAVLDRINAVAKEHGIGRRRAAAIVLKQIREMR